jgi:hypothetical protein
VLPEQDDDSFNIKNMYENEENYELQYCDIDDEKQRKHNESKRMGREERK